MSPDGKYVACRDGGTVQLAKVTARGNADDTPILLTALFQNATVTLDSQPTALDAYLTADGLKMLGEL